MMLIPVAISIMPLTILKYFHPLLTGVILQIASLCSVMCGVVLLLIYSGHVPVSIVDYFSIMKDLYNSYLADSANSIMRSSNFYDAVQFCNLLSVREGLLPVYTLSDIVYNSLWRYS